MGAQGPGTGSHLMGIREERLDGSREVKVKMAVGHLIRLHGIKIVEGRGISESIADALVLYFRQLEEQASSKEDAEPKRP